MIGPGTSPSADEPLASLGDQFAQEELRSSARVLIMLSLGVNRRMSFVALLRLSHCGKGSLSYHLKQLEGAGLIRTSAVFTLGGPRVVAEITPKGQTRYSGLIEELQRLPAESETPESAPS